MHCMCAYMLLPVYTQKSYKGGYQRRAYAKGAGMAFLGKA